jgi:metallo-beta-lactamase family protein
MKITLMGAAGEVTGSSYLIQTSHNTILLDFGMHQGGKEAEKRNYEPLRFDPSKLDAVILTHAHFDHCGRLPLLLKGGFRGRIMCTGPTIGLANLILQDAAFHQQRRFESEERRTPGDEEPENEAGIQPLYTAEEATDTIALCQACDYEKFYQVGRDIEFTFRDAGHILGAASVALRVNEGGEAPYYYLLGGYRAK